MKRSALRTEDGALYDGRASSDDEIVASSFGLIAIFLRHSPDSPVFQEEAFNSLKGFLNSLDLGVLCEEDAHMVKTPVVREKAIASRRGKISAQPHILIMHTVFVQRKQ